MYPDTLAVLGKFQAIVCNDQNVMKLQGSNNRSNFVFEKGTFSQIRSHIMYFIYVIYIICIHLLIKYLKYICFIFFSSCGKEKKIVLKVLKPAIGWLWGIQIQKEVKSNQKQLSCKKRCGPKKAMVKKDVKSKVVAKKWL